MITHGACGKQWTGGRTSHCGRCHETFSGIGAFDMHQRGETCQPPDQVKGLVPVEKPWGVCWSQPERDTQWWQDHRAA